jgi:hypothetical protein
MVPVERKAAGLQDPAHFGKQPLAQAMALQPVAKVEHGGFVGYPLAAQIDAHEVAQAGAVVQRFLHGVVGQVEPVLQQVDAQHALQPDRTAAVAGLGVVRLDDRAQGSPGHDGVHGLQKVLALGAAAKAFESATLIGRHRQCLLLHRSLALCLLCIHSSKHRARELDQSCLRPHCGHVTYA